MHQQLLALSLTILAIAPAYAQRVYAPAMETYESNEPEVAEETLVYVVQPEHIENILTTEKQIHIQLNRSAREYFYTLTSLNAGKRLVIKSAAGETIQDAIIPRAIDSGLILSSPIQRRGEMLSFAQRIKQGRERKVIDSSGFTSSKLPVPKEDPYAIPTLKETEEVELFKVILDDE